MPLRQENVPDREAVRCVLLLGAGASCPAGYPTTPELLDDLSGWVRPDLRETLEFVVARLESGTDADEPSLDDLVRELRHVVPDERTGVVIPEFIEERTERLQRESTHSISKLDEWFQSIGYDDPSPWVVEDRLEIIQSNVDDLTGLRREYEGFRNDCEDVLAAVIELIYHELSWRDYLRGGYEELEPYLRVLSETNDGQLPVFTTNYDATVESLMAREFEINTLFEDPYRSDGQWLGEDAFRAGSDVVNLFKLHGSLTWWRRDGRVQELPYKSPNATAPQEGEWEFIPPGHATGEKRLGEPYRTYFDYLEFYLDAADHCVVVGHRLLDPELVDVIERHDPRLVVVSPSATEIRNRLAAETDISKVDVVCGRMQDVVEEVERKL